MKSVERHLQLLIDLAAERLEAEQERSAIALAACQARLSAYCHALLIVQGQTPTEAEIERLGLVAYENAVLVHAVDGLQPRVVS